MQIAILAGSNRRESASTRMARYLQTRIQSLGHHARLFDLRENPLPLYDPDADGTPEAVLELDSLMRECDAIVLTTPEYHGTVSGVLKNALDYLGSEHFDGKAVLSVSAAGGAGGVSSLTHMQAIVRNLHGVNCPDWISIGGDQRRFGPDGEPADERMRLRVGHVLGNFVRLGELLQMEKSAMK